MNIYLLDIVVKLVKVITLVVISVVGNFSLQKTEVSTKNINTLKGVTIRNEIIPYETKYIYQNNIPANVKKVVSEGIEGVVHYDEEGDLVKIYKESQNKVVKYGNAEVGEYFGRMTGYGPDCKTCNGKGIVGCPAPGGVWHNLIDDTEYYTDKDYGKVRILAATKELFRCGTIIEVVNGNNKFYGVVLDRGFAMEQGYRDGKIIIDLAFQSEVDDIKDIRAITSNSVYFNVKRWGF